MQRVGWRGDLRSLRVAVGYLVQLSGEDSTETRPAKSLGTAVAMTRRHFLAARSHVFDENGPIDRLAVGFLGHSPSPVAFARPGTHVSPGLVVLELVSGLLPVELDVHGISDRIPLVGRRWVSVGFPRTFTTRKMTVVEGTLSATVRHSADAVLIDLECEPKLSSSRARGLEGAPLYIEQSNSPWALSGFLVREDPNFTSNPIGLTAHMPKLKPEDGISDDVDHLLEEFHVFEKRPAFQAIQPRYQELFAVDVLWEGLRHQIGYPTREDIRAQFRSARRSNFGRPARPSGITLPAID